MERYYLTILLMAAVTFLPRVLPVLFLSRRRLPAALSRWLAYIPVAVLAALLGPALLAPAEKLDLSSSNLFFWASIPVFLIAYSSRNLFITVLSGMGLIALWRLLW